MSIAHRAMSISYIELNPMYELWSYHDNRMNPMYEHSSCMIFVLSCMINVDHGLYHDPYLEEHMVKLGQLWSFGIVKSKGWWWGWYSAFDFQDHLFFKRNHLDQPVNDASTLACRDTSALEPVDLQPSLDGDYHGGDNGVGGRRLEGRLDDHWENGRRWLNYFENLDQNSAWS